MGEINGFYLKPLAIHSKKTGINIPMNKQAHTNQGRVYLKAIIIPNIVVTNSPNDIKIIR